MSFNPNPRRIWDRNTPADGDLFQAEFLRIYNNFNNLNSREIDLRAIQKGLALGYLQVTASSPNIITVPKWNVYEVKNKFIQIPSSLNLDFGALSNIFRSV